jgi:hypothetical protein
MEDKTLGDLDVDRRITLKLIVKEQCMAPEFSLFW